MQSEQTITVDLSATTNTRSVSADVAVPPWANTVSIFPRASSWGTGPAATVTLKDSAAGRSGFDGLAAAVTFTSSTPQRRIDVRGSERLRIETTTAAGSGADDTAAFLFVFSDVVVPPPATAATTPGGSDTHVQYNSAGVFAGSVSFVIDVGAGYLATDLLFKAGAGSGYDAYLGTTNINQVVAIGDTGGVGNGTILILDDSTMTISYEGNFVLADTVGAPVDSPAAGTARYDRTNNVLYLFDGSAWNAH